jgi:Ser/Thr protein kinase RdoA (MazF antagonist)
LRARRVHRIALSQAEAVAVNAPPVGDALTLKETNGTMSLLHHAPTFDLEQARAVAKDLYNLVAVAKHLPSERDQNFLLTTESGDRFVLKIANSLEQRILLEAQNAAMRHLQQRLAFCPRIVNASTGESIIQILTEGGPHYVRVVAYIPGKPLAKVKHSAKLLFDFGKKLGTLTRVLEDFDHPALHGHFHWDLANGLRVIDEYDRLLTQKALRAEIDNCVRRIEQSLGARLAELPRSVIHGDANDYNVIVEHDKVVGLIDFGDMIYSYTIGDLAVAIAYIVLDKADPLSCAGDVVAGYVSEWSLNEDELEVLWSFILLRLCMSICLAEHQLKQKPDNAYLVVSQRSIRNSLPGLLDIDERHATNVFREIVKRSVI